jgi:membrane-associated phospholipid phosphatase
MPHHGWMLSNRADFLALNEWARDTAWLHSFMRLVANDGVFVFAALLLAGWWVARRRQDSLAIARVFATGAACLAALIIAQPISHHVRERRPFAALPDVLVLVHRSADYGFPSDHATLAGAVAAGLLFVSWRLGLVASVLALLMAFARVYVGVHYPSDVLAGLCLGAAIAAGAVLLIAPLLARLIDALKRTWLRPLLASG